MGKGLNADDIGYGTAWLRSCRKEVSENGSRVAELINWWLRGIYHAQSDVLRADWSGDFVELIYYARGGQLATYDADDLTRLVVGAHDAAIRVSIEACNPQYLRLWFHPRSRNGENFYSRHPSMIGRLIRWTDRLPQYADKPTEESATA